MSHAKEEGTSVPAVLSLQAIKGPCEGTTLSKAGKRLTVGRTRVRDIHIKDAAVSEKHAELRWEGNRWTVTDVGSSNGTVLNGKKLSDGEPAELKNGDVVLFGSESQMRVQITPASVESTTVEQHLRSECEMLMQRVQAQAEQHANELLNQWEHAKKALITASV